MRVTNAPRSCVSTQRVHAMWLVCGGCPLAGCSVHHNRKNNVDFFEVELQPLKSTLQRRSRSVAKAPMNAMQRLHINNCGGALPESRALDARWRTDIKGLHELCYGVAKFDGLTPGWAYRSRVRCHNCYGWSRW